MKCPSCDYDILDKKSKFCSDCGFKLLATTSNTEGKWTSLEIQFILMY